MDAPELPAITLKSDSALGLFLHYEETDAEDLRDCLTEDRVAFSFNPPEAAHLTQPERPFSFSARDIRARWQTSWNLLARQ